MFEIIVLLLELFLLVLFAYSILSWVIAAGRLSYDSPVHKIQNVLSSICEPVLRPVRRLIKPMGGLDFSFLVVILVAQFVLIPVLLH